MPRLAAAILAAMIAILAATAGAPLAAQQCQPAGGGPPCESGDGLASLGDADGSDLTVGNPFHPITGNKYQEEVDAPALPGFLGLEIRRHFNAAYVSAPSPWGRGWTLSYETRLYRHGDTLQIVQADGRRLVFGAPPAPSFGIATADEACSAAAPAQGDLFVERDGYRWLWPHRRELRFDTAGLLMTIRPGGGSEAEATRIDRDAAGRITRVADPAGRSLRIAYDRNGHLSRIEHPLGTWQYRIDGSGRLQAVTAPDGVVRGYRYDDPGHPHRFTAVTLQPPGAAERVVAQWDYDAAGRVVRHRRADGGELRMAYDQQAVERPGSGPQAPASAGTGETVSVLTNAVGARTRFTAIAVGGRWRVTGIEGPGCEECGPRNLRLRYDARGLLVARRRIGGDGVAYQRDAQGRVVRLSRLDADGKPSSADLLRFEYADARTHLPRLVARPSVVAGKEHRILLTRDARGNLLEMLESGYAPGVDGEPEQPIARKTVLRYQTIAGRLVLKEVDGPLDNGPAADPADSDITRFGYDDAGRFLQLIEIPGGSWRRVAARDAAGRAVVTVSGDGHREVEEERVFDFRHRILRLRTTAWRLEAMRRLPESAVVMASSRRYDPFGRLLQVQDDAGRQMLFRHDAAGRLLGIGDARGYRTELSRDAEGRIVANGLFEPGSADPLRASYYGRNRDGGLESLLLADGRRFAFHYDEDGRATAITGPDGFLRLAATPSVDRTAAPVVVDDFGRVVEQVLPDHGRRTMRYDEAGRLVALTDAAGARFSFLHDIAGRLLGRRIGGAAGEESVTFGYQGSLLVRAQGSAQSTVWQYDAAGRIVETSVALTGLSGPPLRMTRSWDPATGLPASQGLVDGRTLSLRRLPVAEGGAPRQVHLRSRFWSAAESVLKRWLPDRAAARATTLLPATVIARDVDVHPFDGLTGMKFFNGSVMRRTVDPAGRTVQLFTGPPDRPVAHWRYGHGNGSLIRRVENLAAPGGGDARIRHLAYDASGRLERPAVHAHDGKASTAALMQGAPTGLSARGAGLVFDRAGRVAGDGRFRYAYTPRGQVKSVHELPGQRLVATYAYNHSGQRVRKTVHAVDGSIASTFFLWDEERLVAEIAADGSIAAQYLVIDDGRRSVPIARLQGPGPQIHDAALTRSADRRVLAIHADHRGAPVALTDADGRVAWQAEVDPWGAATERSIAGGIEMNLRLPGQYFDAETGLHDNWHRSYDPAGGRYLQPDPIGYPHGPDAYAYAGADPVNRIDPLGLYEIDVHYYMTFFLGVTAGLDPEEARIVALAAQYVDDNPLTRPVDAGHVGSTVASVLGNQARLLGYHFVLSGTDGRTLPQYRNDQLDVLDSPQLANLLDAAQRIGLGRGARLQFLGEYLHALADTYAHRNARNIPYDALVLGCGVGHGLAGHEPDLTYDDIPPWAGPGIVGVPVGRTPWRREARTLAMELELHGVLLAVGDPSRARDAADIEATLRAFNAIRESENRGGDFSQKIELLQSRLASLGYGHLDLRNEELYGYSERDARTNRLVFLRHPGTGAPLREEDFPGVCLEGGTRCGSR